MNKKRKNRTEQETRGLAHGEEKLAVRRPKLVTHARDTRTHLEVEEVGKNQAVKDVPVHIVIGHPFEPATETWGKATHT